MAPGRTAGIAAAILAAAAAHLLWDLGGRAYNGDEVLTILEARRPWSEVLEGHEPSHGPLPFLLWKLWIAGGEAEAWMRLPAALWGIAALAIFFRFARRVAGDGPALVALAILAFSPHFVFWARIARHYTLWLFVALLALDLAWIGARGRRWTPTIAAAILTGVAFQLHYATVYLLPALCLIPFLVPERRWWIAAPAPLLGALGVLAIAGAIAPGFWEQLIGSARINLQDVASYHIPGGRPGRLGYVLYAFALGDTVYPWTWPATVPALLGFATAAIAGWLAARRRDRRTAWALAALVALPVLGLCATAGRFAPRYVLPSQAMLALLLAVGLLSLRRFPRALAALAIVAPVVYSLANYRLGREYLTPVALDPSRELVEGPLAPFDPDRDHLVLTSHGVTVRYYVERRTGRDYSEMNTWTLPSFPGDPPPLTLARRGRRVPLADVELTGRWLWVVRMVPGGARDPAARTRSLDDAFSLLDRRWALVSEWRGGRDPAAAMKTKLLGRPCPEWRVVVRCYDLNRAGSE